MTSTTQVLVISGSERKGSWNKKLQAVAIARLRAAGCEPKPLDLRALNLPLYDGDLEAASGVPASVNALVAAVHGSDAVLIVTPEYNGFPTPLVINAFDWLSRVQAQADQPAGLAATANKPVALLAASPGPNGALRAMNFLRQYLQMAFAMVVVPQQFALGRANEAFDDNGTLKDPKALQAVDGVVRALLRLATALRAT